MSYTASHSLRSFRARGKGLFVAVCSALLTTACAGSNGIGEQTLALLSSDAKPEQPQAAPTGGPELMKATEYWRKEYMKNPKKKDPALNYARNLKAMGQKKQALKVLQMASSFHAQDSAIASEYGRLALDLGQVSVAKRLLSVADDPTKPDWRVVSARGTVLAKEGQYGAAQKFYQRALQMSPGQPSVMNNLALAHMMNGDSKSAETMLRQAVSKGGPYAAKARQNLALALGVQGKYNESTSIGSSVLPRAHASSNSEYLKKLVRLAPADRPSAMPANAVQPARAYAKGPMTPDQIIAQAKAASGQLTPTHVAKPQAAKVSQTYNRGKANAKAAVVRTVAKRTGPQGSSMQFKPSSF